MNVAKKNLASCQIMLMQVTDVGKVGELHPNNENHGGRTALMMFLL